MAVDMTVASASALEPCVDLFDRLIRGDIAAPAFADAFTRWYLADATAWDPSVFSVLESVFASADAYEEDDTLRPQVIDAIDESALRAAVARARALLSEPAERSR